MSHTYTLRAECPICGEDVVHHMVHYSGTYWVQGSEDCSRSETCEHFTEDDGDVAVFSDGSRVAYRESDDYDGPDCREDD